VSIHTKISIFSTVKTVGLLLILVVISFKTFAHGSANVKSNSCVLSVGPYQMQVSGYQPLNSLREHCNEMPGIGNTIIVVDYLDQKMRDFIAEYRVIRDVKNVHDANISHEHDNHDLHSSFGISSKPAIYSNGTFDFSHNFNTGRYISIFTLRDPFTNEEFHAEFPFTVGMPFAKWMWIAVAVILILLFGSLLEYLSRPRSHDA
jgi:hypothetical protein